ncbi:MAG TPA: hypothetical protein VIY72_03005, partial [Acidimicrobiales bacterium]
MTATPGAPAAVPTDVESVPIRAARRSGSRMLVVASEATIALGALWLLVMVVPYLATPDGTTIALADAGPLRDSTVLPRLVGVVLSSVAAALALALPRWRAGFSCTAASALAALAAFSAWWAFGVRTGSGTPPRIGWYADLVLAVLAVVTVWLSVIGVRRSLAGWPRLHDRRLLSSTPYVAVTTAAVAVVTDWLLIRDPLFPAAFAAGSEAVVTDQAPLAMRLVAALMAILLVVVPVLATIAPERRVGQGLAL